jgi:plastocyanin
VKRLLVGLAIATATVPAVAVPAQAGGGCHRQTATDMRGVTATLVDNCFDPVVLRVEPGQRVRWVNKDQTAHTVTGAAGRWGSYEELAAGKTVAWRFDQAGVFPYFCIVHPGMIGAVVVGDGRSADTTVQDATITYVDEAPPPAAAVPAAQPQTRPVAADADRDTGPIVAALLALAGAVLIGAVVLLARRTPSAQPHPQV